MYKIDNAMVRPASLKICQLLSDIPSSLTPPIFDETNFAFDEEYDAKMSFFFCKETNSNKGPYRGKYSWHGMSRGSSVQNMPGRAPSQAAAVQRR
jgi:hypothetical protein